MSTSIDESTPAAPAVPSDKTNLLAISALVLSFIVTIGGIVCGHIALRQIKRTGEQGRGLALTAITLGYVFTAFWSCVLLVVVPFLILTADVWTDSGY